MTLTILGLIESKNCASPLDDSGPAESVLELSASVTSHRPLCVIIGLFPFIFLTSRPKGR